MKTILILNGPSLNMLGTREPEIYGRGTLADLEALCMNEAKALGLAVDFRQSNHEGALIDWIHEAVTSGVAGVIINAGAYTHTSVALHDALKILTVPVIEVHLSDPKTREPFRHHSYIAPLARAVITGKGPQGYAEALKALTKLSS